MNEVWAMTYDKGLYLFSSLSAAFGSVSKLHPDAHVEMSNDDNFAVLTVMDGDDNLQDRVYIRKLRVHKDAVAISQAGDNQVDTAASVPQTGE
jgi:hypothetical protein